MARAPRSTTKAVETLTHDEARRKNIPTAEYQSVVDRDTESPLRVEFERRNPDLDPQLVWRGKDTEDWSDLVVQAPPIYIQEKVHPKVLIDDLLRQSKNTEPAPEHLQGGFADLFADFNGVPEGVDKTEFYKHDANWTNRMILGDSLQVMASLAEREGLRGKVQCIYIDPPYGIKFNSNFQWSTRTRDVKDGNAAHITREPEQVKAFRDTWRDGIHSYLTYLRDRLTVARDLLSDTGSVFVQIGDENVHRVRALMDELFGDENCVSVITLKKTAGQDERLINNVADYIVWYAKDKGAVKYRDALGLRTQNIQELGQYTRLQAQDGRRRATTLDDFDAKGELQSEGRPFRLVIATSSGHGGNTPYPIEFAGRTYLPTANRHWSTHSAGFHRLIAAERIAVSGATLAYVRFFDDFVAQTSNNIWADLGTTTDKKYVVETAPAVIQRCILMTTDPGDLVLDPTCGSGTTAYVAEQWGRRWITVDTSRVALALARARIMGARYPYYLLADSSEGQQKEAEVTRTAPSSQPTHGDIRHGFVYERVPHVTLKSIANNAEIDVIWEERQKTLEPLREALNAEVGKSWQEWDIPRDANTGWSAQAKDLHAKWWEARIARQKEIDSSIAAKAEFEYLYDRPYQDTKTVRVAGPLTVESLSPHRILGVDENDELIDTLRETGDEYGEGQSFVQMILENLRTSGVQQAHKEDRIEFTSLVPWPGDLVCAEGRYFEGEGAGPEKRAAIFIGPEFGTVSRPDLVRAAREAGDGGFDVIIACAFNYDAHSTDFANLGRIPVLKARMNADLHMAADLKNTGKGNLFVIFGEPDIDILDAPEGEIQVKVNGVDVFHPATGEVRSDGPEGIACWFIDTDYNEESFFVRHAYFLGANDPYKSLRATLKAEINEDAWATLNSDTSRPFPKPESGRIAVKVINHLGDEVMKVFRV
ncbi:MAG: site-specific DNA-methyltransferase [Dehalococcoidia bacterium]|nr:site-specific DNA-methyltransferase [Dehalococcoidia bacterium]